MKKISNLCLLGLVGFLAVFAIPTFAQEAYEIADVDTAVIEPTDESDINGVIPDEAVVNETSTTEDSFIESIKNDPELVENLNTAMDDFLEELDDQEITDEINNAAKTPEDRAVLAAIIGFLFAGAGVIYFIGCIILAIIMIIALWKIFKKAGEKGWKSIIPFYNVYITFKIAGVKSFFWWIIAICIIAGILIAIFPDNQETIGSIASTICGILFIIASFKLPRKFGWGVFTSILYVLFTPICQIILAFDGSKYQGNKY